MRGRINILDVYGFWSPLNTTKVVSSSTHQKQQQKFFNKKYFYLMDS